MKINNLFQNVKIRLFIKLNVRLFYHTLFGKKNFTSICILGIYAFDKLLKWNMTNRVETVTCNFNITGVMSIEEENSNSTSVYPNPIQ